MSLEWMPREHELKDHSLHQDPCWGDEAPSVVFEKKPLTDPKGNVVDGLFVAWIRLNNPRQYNSYTTDMVKGVIAGFDNASLDRSVIAVVPGNSYSLDVGAGGAGRVGNGRNGGDSTFNGTTVVGKGGDGGIGPSSNNSGGAGGDGSTSDGIGDVVYPGGGGADGVS